MSNTSFTDHVNLDLEKQIKLSTTRKQSSLNMNSLKLNVKTYLLILEMNWIDTQKKTCSIWCELGFYYNVDQYLRTFDYFGFDQCKGGNNEKEFKIKAKDMQIPFEVINAVAMDKKSEAHFIHHLPDEPSAFMLGRQGQSEVNMRKCDQNQYWKFETRTYRMELAYKTSENLSPFDEMHIFFKLITANCQYGTEYIFFDYQKNESDYAGMKKIQGYYPCPDCVRVLVDGTKKIEPKISMSHSYSNSVGKWHRLYISVPFQSLKRQTIFQYYMIPCLLFGYLVLYTYSDVDNLLGVSATLVLANVALLITKPDIVFTNYEQAILSQIFWIVVVTLVLAFSDDLGIDDLLKDRNFRFMIFLANVIFLLLLTYFQYINAKKYNSKIRSAIESNNFEVLQTI